MALPRAMHTHHLVLHFSHMNHSKYDWVKKNQASLQKLRLQGIVGWNYLLSLIKDGPVYQMLKEIIKEALELLSLVFD